MLVVTCVPPSNNSGRTNRMADGVVSATPTTEVSLDWAIHTGGDICCSAADAAGSSSGRTLLRACILAWRVKCELYVNALPHVGHRNGRDPV